TGSEYARLVLEDFHGTAEALVFPEAWARLNAVIRPDQALLLTGSYSARDRGEEQAPFIVEAVRALDELRPSGAIAVELRWSAADPPDPEATRAVAALCAAHPGPAPVHVRWADGGGNGGGGGGGGGRGAGWGGRDRAKVLVRAHQKGRDTEDELRRNAGMAHREGYRKALRLMQLAGKFHAPVITLVDTPAAYPGLGAEERGQAEAIA